MWLNSVGQDILSVSIGEMPRYILILSLLSYPFPFLLLLFFFFSFFSFFLLESLDNNCILPRIYRSLPSSQDVLLHQSTAAPRPCCVSHLLSQATNNAQVPSMVLTMLGRLDVPGSIR